MCRPEPKNRQQSLCLECEECKDFVYKRFDRNGNLQTFQYCKGNQKEVKISHWYMQKDGYYYSTRYINGRKRFFHTLFKKDKDKVIDHINGDRADNRLRMLREITPSCNSQNIRWEHKRVTSKFPGVYWNRKEECWMCQARKHKANNPKSIHISKMGFKTEYEAFDYYLKLLKELDRTINTQTDVYQDYLKWKSEQQQSTLEAFL